MRRATLAALTAAVAVLVSCESGGPQYSDSPSAASIAFSTEANRLDIAYEKCPGDPVPGVGVSEETEGPSLRWTVTERVRFPDGAFFIATRPSREDGPPPAADARLSVIIETEDPVEVHGLRISDLPVSDGDDVLTAEGETRSRDSWRAAVAETCAR